MVVLLPEAPPSCSWLLGGPGASSALLCVPGWESRLGLFSRDLDGFDGDGWGFYLVIKMSLIPCWGLIFQGELGSCRSPFQRAETVVFISAWCLF